MRLKRALQNLGEKPKMLVAARSGTDIATMEVRPSLRYRYAWLAERLGVFLRQGLSRKHLWDIDPASRGVDITRLPEFQEADIIHLHWVNQGFLSLRGLRKIFRSGKPVVWTMHDMWPFTGLCHNAVSCRRFEEQCGQCELLCRRADGDLSRRVWLRKQALYSIPCRKAFVACSKWLAEEARKSGLLAEQLVLDIPNPIDTTLFAVRNQAEARRRLGLPAEKKLILFSAFNVNAPIKGLDFLREACCQLVADDAAWAERVAVVCVGKGADDVASTMPLEVCSMGYVNDPKQMAALYNAVDLFCIPSLQENLPNTIMEAKASGVPVVGFSVGGIPQMIRHRLDGYLAKPQDAADLASGIRWALTEADATALKELNRAEAVSQYSEQRVAEQYLKLYQRLLDND